LPAGTFIFNPLPTLAYFCVLALVQQCHYGLLKKFGCGALKQAFLPGTVHGLLKKLQRGIFSIARLFHKNNTGVIVWCHAVTFA